MKSQITFIIAICFISLQLFGQKKEIRVGISAGLNSSNVKKKDGAFVGWNYMNSDFGYILTTDLSFKINSNFFINTGLGYEMNKFNSMESYGTENYLTEYELGNLNFPFIIQITTDKKVNFFTNIGFQTQYALQNRLRVIHENTSVFQSNGFDLYELGYGILLGMGVSYNVGKKYNSKIETRAYRQFNPLYKAHVFNSNFPKFNAYSIALVISFSRRFTGNQDNPKAVQ